MDILYPMFYGMRLVTLDVLRATFEPHMHPESARRGFAFIKSKGGLLGIGGGYRAIGNQPDKPGFAPEGKSFHQQQQFPSGLFYTAWDMVAVNPGFTHRSPRWAEVPKQGTVQALDYAWHMNIDTEPWHAQPIELDGWQQWVNRGRPDIQYNRWILTGSPLPPVPQPPTPDPTTQPPAQGVIVEFTSRTLNQGAVGNDVKFYQRQMNDISGAQLLLDGHFGAKTTQAVRNWQTFFNLTVDGQLGPKTQRSIIEISLQV